MKNLFRTVLLLTFVALSASAVYPCVCEIMKPSKKLRKAKAVFIGEVVEIGRNDKSEQASVAVKFKVERYWKGVKEQFVTVVGAPAAAGACGLPVEIGKKYLIYAFKMEEGQLETSFCDSRWIDRATEDLAFLGKGKELKPKE
jgi:hypothetical protein